MTMIWGLFNKRELSLYFVLMVMTAVMHLVILLLSQSDAFNFLKSSQIERAKSLDIKLAGVENSNRREGDLSQMKTPDKIVKNKLAKKQLQTSEKTNFNVNFARRIAPVAPKKKQKKSKVFEKPSENKKSLPPLDLSDLGYKRETTLPSIEYRQNDIASFAEQQRILETITGQAASLDLRNVSSSVQIEVPNGVPLDQLNTIERKFYSFKNRVFKAYVYSLLNQAYHQQTPNDPFPFVRERTRLYARVTFDKEGNILRIQTIEAGNNKKLQSVFLTALKEIRAIPNPPKEIINDKGEFTHGFILDIRN